MTTENNVTAARTDSILQNSSSYVIPGVYDISVDDATWVLSSSFIIFTMQTGFGMLESGCVSVKNEANIMMKNIVDIVLGGFTYWLVGYGISFGRGTLSNPFIAIGDFLTDPPMGDPLMGQILTAFLFQLSFATTATTIVSGAMAERTNFKAYCLYSLLNPIIYCVSAGWVWGEHGFLNNLGVVDIAGSGPVHLIGGASAFAAAVMLGPRLGRYAKGTDPLPLGSPVNTILGLFLLWWGWLVFNSGSTYGVSGEKWQYASRAAVVTMLGSFGGGIASVGYSMFRHSGRIDVIDLVNGILGALVSITAGCFLYRAWEAILIGSLGALLCCLVMPLFDRFHVDDPVGASAVHGVCGIWGVLAVGLFAGDPTPLGTTKGRLGLFKGGGFDLLGIQAITALCLACWGICSTFLLLYVVNKIIPIRMDHDEELEGADYADHRIQNSQIRLARELAQFRMDIEKIVGIVPISDGGLNSTNLHELRATEDKLNQWQIYMDRRQSSAIEDTQMYPIPKTTIAGNHLSKRLNCLNGNSSDRSEHIVSSDVGGVFKAKNTEVATLGSDNVAFNSSD
ncbi:putative ammonium transporter 3 [Eupeodes corollae]|uniref:putative ammonium transporter 3 n=1 Tax=Eupeodes corollae TaxID=290404 RepID=UPI002492ED0B|nr:putative ammonium transporter 3 [Eupeodes corollae]